MFKTFRQGWLFLLLWVCSGSMAAQTMDAGTVYAEFSKQSAILRSAPDYSAEYEQARKTMLQLFPQLQYHAAVNSQKGNRNNALVFAKAYVDMAMMPQFADMHLEKSADYASMTYFVASNYFNSKDYNNAAIYLDRYLAVNEPKNRTTVFLFLAKTYENLRQTDKQLDVIRNGLAEYPTDNNLLAMAINLCMENGWYQDADQYIKMALLARPNDAKLMSLQGQCYEARGLYEQAVGVYELLAQRQKSLNIYKHYALNLFNCATLYQQSNANLANQYLTRAIPILQQVVASDPTSVQYNTALALAYLHTDQYDAMAEVNERLHSLGAAEVGVANVSNTLAAMNSDIKRPSSTPQSAQAPKSSYSKPSETTTASTSTPKSETKKGDDFASYAQMYVEKEILQWQQKDPYETVEEYAERVTEARRDEKVKVLMDEAKKMYVSKYEKSLRLSDFSLQPYDAENRVFLINSRYGDIVLPVPRENDEARLFAANWKSLKMKNPTLDIANNELIVRSIDFVTNSGKTYHYSDQDIAKYEQTQINLQFDKIDYSALATTGGSGSRKVTIQKNNVTVGSSDVDINIPENKATNTNTFAFLIGNENYQQIAHVPYAIHDVETMSDYCERTLGIPESNIRTYKDATFGKMLSCVRDIRSIAEAYNSDINIIFYYAGHGVPNEASKTAYLLPVDADGTQTETCYSVSRLYQELGKLGANQVIVLMDACFSGAQRGEGMIAQARGVALKVKQDAPQGNTVVLSAATGDETAFPYEEKQHGMFTYFVLKHLQDTKGKTTIEKLASYVQTEVKQKSVVINKKSQTPTVSASADAANWERWSLR